MRPELRPDIDAQLRAELIDRVAEELHAQTAAGAENVIVESSEPEAGEVYRVLVKSDKLDAPKIISVREDE